MQWSHGDDDCAGGNGGKRHTLETSEATTVEMSVAISGALMTMGMLDPVTCHAHSDARAHGTWGGRLGVGWRHAARPTFPMCAPPPADLITTTEAALELNADSQVFT
jgi:hypothetical protein